MSSSRTSRAALAPFPPRWPQLRPPELGPFRWGTWGVVAKPARALAHAHAADRYSREWIAVGSKGAHRTALGLLVGKKRAADCSARFQSARRSIMGTATVAACRQKWIAIARSSSNRAVTHCLLDHPALSRAFHAKRRLTANCESLSFHCS